MSWFQIALSLSLPPPENTILLQQTDPSVLQSWLPSGLVPFFIIIQTLIIIALVFNIINRRRTEQALRASEERFRLAGKAAYDLIYEWDVSNDRLTWFSDVDQFLGYEPGVISSDIQSWLNLIHPDDQRLLANAVELHRTSTQEIRYEYRIRHRDGSYRYWRDRGLPLLNPNGQPTRWVGVCTDVTGRVQTAHEIRTKESALAASINAIALADLDGNLNYVNQAFLDMWGYEHPDEVLGQPAISFWQNPDDATGVIQALMKHGSWMGELAARRKNDQTFYAQLSANLIFDVQNQPLALMASFIDITHSKETETSLRENEQRVQLALQGADLGLWDWHIPSGRVIFNERWAAMLGYHLSELEPNVSTWERLLHPDDVPMVSEVLQTHLDGYSDLYETEHRMQAKDGSWVWILDRGRVLERDKTGKPIRAVGTHLDITERKQAEARIAHLNQVLVAVRNVNKLIVHEKDPQQLIQRACDTFVQSRGYHNAWIALFDPQGALLLTAESGLDHYFSEVKAQLQRGHIPQCGQHALQQTGVQIIEKPSQTCQDCPLADFYADRGAMTIRLEYRARIFGFLTVSIPSQFAYDPEEHAILEEVANDLAMALHQLETEAQVSQLTRMVTTIPQPIALISPDYHYLALNETYARLFDRSIDDILGQPVSSVITPADFEKEVKPRLTRCLQSGETVWYQLQLNWPERGQRWMELRYFPYREESGRIVGVISHMLDITERVAAESEIRKFRTISDNAVHGNAITNLDGDIIYVNDYFARIHGYTPEALLGRHLSIFHNQAQYAQVAETLTEMHETGTFGPTEVWHTHRNGQGFPMLMSGVVITDAHEQPQYLAATAIDISELKQTETLLRAQQEAYRLLVENQTDLIVKIDREGCFEFVSPSYCQMFGKEEQELLGRSFVPQIHEDDRESTLRAMEALYVPPHRAYMEQRAWTPDGWRWLEWVDTAIVDDEGQVVSIVGVGRDITERKETEDKLRQLNEAIEQSPVSVVITNAEGNIEYVNPKFCQITGYSTAEIMGQNPRLLKSDHHPPIFYERMWAALTRGETWQGELCNKKKNGELYWELASIVGVKNAAGTITHYVAVKEDITERRNIAEERVRQERLAAVGQLSAGIAHDFNNILTGIIGFADLLQRRPEVPTSIVPDLNQIIEQGQRAAELIHQILDFSRQTVTKPQPLDLKIYLSEALKFIERTIPEHIDIQFHFSPGNHTINADPSQLHQVVTNLAVNARDAMPNGGTLSFNLSQITLGEDDPLPCSKLQPGRWVRLDVSDTGNGIDPATLPHIFEPFFTTKDIGYGTGLGLAQVYGIIEQHEGCISVHSHTGDGSRFTLYFPALATPVQQVPTGTISLPKGNEETILLVEDEPVVLDVIQKMLRRLNYQVISATDGQEALTIYRQHPNEIAAVVTDAVMPNLDGLELAEALHITAPQLPILVISGYARDLKNAESLSANVVARLQKPLQLVQLAQALQDALN